jgi:pectinesterase
VVVEIRDGLYTEKLRIDQNRVTLRGESRDGTRIAYHLPRSEYDKRYDRAGPGVVNVFGEDLVFENLTIENTQPTSEHAFAMYGQPQRLVLDNCAVVGNGGDTLSLWNTSFGMYYHRNCKFRGGVDFVCPRGWCFIRDSEFESAGTSAAIWQDGHMNLSMKFVIRNSDFTGPAGFWLGRNHYPAQFYLLDCRFGANLDDKPIGVVGSRPDSDSPIYQRKYFYNCHREGGDYAWFADNLSSAPGSPSPQAITAAWTFDGRWDPESAAPPKITSVEVEADAVFIYFDQPVAGAESTQVVRADGSVTKYAAGNGTRCLKFVGGRPDSKPVKLIAGGEQLYGTTAAVEPRFVANQALPTAVPRQKLTILSVGDSTVAAYPIDHAYQGWGWALGPLFDDRVTVVNAARGGRSSKSFRDEGHWDKAIQTPADYVLIQFGHNDNPGKGPERETDPAPGGDFRANLRRYVEEARARGATPVLVSPPTRRFYDESGLIRSNEENVPYAEATRAVAEEVGCQFVDLNAITRDLFNGLGEATSDWVQAAGDRTHFTPAGSRRVAVLLLAELVAGDEHLAQFVDPHDLVGAAGVVEH